MPNSIQRFMVIDDDPVNNILCERTLKKVFAGIEIKIFYESAAALHSIRTEYSNANADINTILFLDINMPFMTGWDFLEEFRMLSPAIHRQFTIYILSSSVDHRDKARAEVNPLVANYLEKPLSAFKITDLLRTIQKRA